MSTMKKTGNLGNIKFSADNKLPDAWPKEKAEKLKCPDGHLSAYAAYNHFCLHDLYSIPAYKPIVIHEKRDNLGVSMMMRNEKKDDGGNVGKGVLCGLLECTEEHKDKLKEKGWTMPNKDEKKKDEAKDKEKDEKKKEDKDKDTSKEGGEKTPLEER